VGTLNPDIPSEELARALDEAATVMRGLRQRVLMPERLLLAFLDNKTYAAHGLLQQRDITPRALSTLLADLALACQSTTRDLVAWPARASSSRATTDRTCCVTCSTC
jgi:hypothetical protein